MQVLSEFHYKPARKMVFIFADYRIRKEGRCQKQNRGGTANVPADVHFHEYMLVQLNNDAEHYNREKALRVIVIVSVLQGLKTEALDRNVLANSDNRSSQHI